MTEVAYKSEGGGVRLTAKIHGQMIVDLTVNGDKEIEYKDDVSGGKIGTLHHAIMSCLLIPPKGGAMPPAPRAWAMCTLCGWHPGYANARTQLRDAARRQQST